NVKNVVAGALNYGNPTSGGHNLFVMNQDGSLVRQLTNQANNALNPADDIQPAFDRTVNPATQVPVPNSFNGFLAFSSKNRTFGSATPASPYDISFYDFPSADVSGDPTAPTENTTTRQVIRVFTPDTNAGAVPLNQTDEFYPSWSAGLPPQKPIDRLVFQ